MEDKRKYQVGDVVYAFIHLRKNLVKLVVTRTTNTQAILSDGAKLRIEITGMTRAIGASGWGVTHYELETPQLAERYNREQLIAKVASLVSAENLKKASNETLQTIVDILTAEGSMGQ